QKPAGFSSRLFVSIPVMVRRFLESPPSTLGVVNVDVSSRSEHPWRRAYSQAWLERTTHLVLPWLTTVWQAFSLSYELGDRFGGISAPLHRAFSDRTGMRADLPSGK